MKKVLPVAILIPVMGAGYSIASFTYSSAIQKDVNDYDAFLYTQDGIVELQDVNSYQALTQKQRADKIEKLKNNVTGFSATDTIRVKKVIDQIFSIQDKSVMEVLDSIPDQTAIKFDSAYSKQTLGYYQSEHNSVGITKEGIASKDIELAGTIAHEFFHAKQHAYGMLHFSKIHTTSKVASDFSLIGEAEAKSFDRHVQFRLTYPNAGSKNFKFPSGDYLGDSIANYGRLFNTFKEKLESDQGLCQAERRKGSASALEAKIQQEAEMKTRGFFMFNYLRGRYSLWATAYLDAAAGGIKDNHYASQEDSRLTAYVYNHLEKTYELSDQEVKDNLSDIYQTDKGQDVLALTKEDNRPFFYTNAESKALKKMAEITANSKSGKGLKSTLAQVSSKNVSSSEVAPSQRGEGKNAQGSFAVHFKAPKTH